MSEWRRKALEFLPEYRLVIDGVDSPTALWCELGHKCEQACKDQHNDLVRRFHMYASYCLHSHDWGVRSAVVCGFYEDIPILPALRKDLPKRLSRADFVLLRDAFTYMISPNDMLLFEREFMMAKDKLERDLTQNHWRGSPGKRPPRLS